MNQRHLLKRQLGLPPLVLDPSTAPSLDPMPPSVNLNFYRLSLKDKVSVVSGGARGFGLVQIEALLEAAKDPESGFLQVSSRVKELGTSLHCYRVDVRDVRDLNQFFQDIANGAGRLSGLIAAAGIKHGSPAIDYPTDETDRMMSINFTGAFMTAQAAARQMIRLKQSGSILMIASMSATSLTRAC
ncbi:oxidoreductase [Fusarium heterosporum]|uniref:Oxidoreductase n=1 Tax=Fusarium heterosporum TaxID=42747 RepID=A0A8H5WXK2_FUSHE|nr:oxidoreductase [Fusarium heterosporum]